MTAQVSAEFELERHVTVERESATVSPAPTQGRMASEMQPRAIETRPHNVVARSEPAAQGPRITLRDEESREQIGSPRVAPARSIEHRGEERNSGEVELPAPVRPVRRIARETSLSDAPPAAKAVDARPAAPMLVTKAEPLRPAPATPAPLRSSERLAGHPPRVETVIRPAAPDRSITATGPSLQPPVVETSAGGPDIHIAIGRIIVNATPGAAASPAPAPRTQTPRIPLEQYLQQRGGRA